MSGSTQYTLYFKAFFRKKKLYTLYQPYIKGRREYFVDTVGNHYVLPSMPLLTWCRYCYCFGALTRRTSSAQAAFLDYLCVFGLGVVL
jgi:hypothetical protein